MPLIKFYLRLSQVEKKHKYSAAATAHFTLLCFLVDNLTGSEAACFIKRLASGLSSCWDGSYFEVLCWICTRLVFAILHATGLCLRGICLEWRCPAYLD